MNDRPWQSFDAVHSPGPDIAYELARRFSIETETYDRTVCTGPIVRDEIQPRTHGEMYAISANAAKIRRGMESEARAAGLTWTDVKRAMRSYENSGQYAADMAAIP